MIHPKSLKITKINTIKKILQTIEINNNQIIKPNKSIKQIKNNNLTKKFNHKKNNLINKLIIMNKVTYQ